jgi:hypothetical protein
VEKKTKKFGEKKTISLSPLPPPHKTHRSENLAQTQKTFKMTGKFSKKDLENLGKREK